MAGIFGMLGLSDTDRAFVNTIGQVVVYDGITRLLERYNADLAAAQAVFVEQTTEDFKERYKLAGGGRLQKRGTLAQSAAVKAYGGYDVAYPLEDYGAQFAGGDIVMAYMTLQELQRHLDTIFIQNTNTVRHALLSALLDNAQDSFVDPLHGALSIEPLANSDSVVYPPVEGSETEATDTHYLSSGYAPTAISDTNNPYIVLRDELEEHFGAVQGGSNIVAFINPAEVPETEDLTDFDAVNDRFTTPGTQTATLNGLPNIPGRVIGRTNGVWVAEWRWIPASYILALHLDAPPPVKMRVDPADTGLARGLTMVAREVNYPLEAAHYRNRFGFGVGHRLSAVAMFLDAGAWAVPAAYD